MKFELHPLCALFPRMAGSEFEALKADIKANGLRQPIVTHQGMILDGGNRYEACMAVGVKPMMTEYTGTNLVTYVLSANFYRRHLSPGQQAAIVASATDWESAHMHGGDRRSDQAEGLPLETVKQRAAVSGATERTQRDADKLVRENPEAAKQVVKGEKSLYQAVKDSRPSKQSEPEPEEFGPDAAELEAQARAERADTEWLQKLMESNEPLAAAQAEIKRLNAQIAVLEVARDGYMNGKNEAIKMVKRLQAKIDKLEKVIS